MIYESIITYACPVWADVALKFAVKRNQVRQTQRRSLNRIARAYRTVSREALCAITGVLPLELKIKERKELYDYKLENEIKDNDDEETKIWKEVLIEEKQKKLEEENWLIWQNMWNNTTHALWIKRLIPNVLKWKNRNFGSLNFRLTQMMTGHGAFGTYTHRIGKSDNDLCWYGCDKADTAEHTFFDCDRWYRERWQLEIELNELITVENWSDIIIKSKEN